MTSQRIKGFLTNYTNNYRNIAKLVYTIIWSHKIYNKKNLFLSVFNTHSGIHNKGL